MSEIAKCPLCGKVPGWHDFDIEARIFGGERSYFCCGMKASTAVRWNRYAVAMELAKAEVAASNAVWSVPLGRLEPAVEAAEDVLFQAKMRVLEVFNAK